MTRKFAPAALAFLAAATLAASAVAAPSGSTSSPEMVTQSVQFDDIDLHTATGAKQAAFRIKMAAAHVCGGDNLQIRAGVRFMDCQSAAIDRALSSMDAPLVSADLGRPATTGYARR